MKRLSILLASLVWSGVLVLGHEGNDHVRGVVTTVSPQSITVETTEKTTRTLTLTSKTTFQLAGKTAHLADVKVGNRVVIEVPAKSSEALLIQIGTAPAIAQTTAKAAPAKKLDITFQSSTKPTKIGDNAFEVTLKDQAGKPVTDAEVSVRLSMPAMPAMKMRAMSNDVTLTHAGAGKYTGTGKVLMGGMWTVTVSVKQNGKEVAQRKSSLTAQ